MAQKSAGFTLSSVTPAATKRGTTWATAIPPRPEQARPRSPAHYTASGPPAATTPRLRPRRCRSRPSRCNPVRTALAQGLPRRRRAALSVRTVRYWIARGVDYTRQPERSGTATADPVSGGQSGPCAAADYEPLEDPSSFAGAVTTLTAKAPSSNLPTIAIRSGHRRAAARAWSSLAPCSQTSSRGSARWPRTTKTTHTSGSAQTMSRRRPEDASQTGTGDLSGDSKYREHQPDLLEPSGSRPPAYGWNATLQRVNAADYTGMTKRDLGSARLRLPDQL